MEPEQMTPRSDLSFAFLVDGDNAQPSLLEPMLTEVSKHGRILIRRIYGDWNSPQMAGWRQALQQYGIKPIQQFPTRKGKNATDVALVIDAMDMLHAKDVNAFCIVASDSDYTSLAIRLREPGRFVMGIGRAETPEAFRNACDVFVYTENLDSTAELKTAKKSANSPDDGDIDLNLEPPGIEIEKPEPAAIMAIPVGPVPVDTGEPVPVVIISPKLDPHDAIPVLVKAFEIVPQTDGWANLASMGEALLRIDPAFDTRTYGPKSLLPFFQAMPDVFEIKKTKPKGPAVIVVRLIANADR